MFSSVDRHTWRRDELRVKGDVLITETHLLLDSDVWEAPGGRECDHGLQLLAGASQEQ